MKVFSIYDKNKNFMAAFPTREYAVMYGRSHYNDGWDYDIVEEYLNKTPYQMYVPPFTSIPTKNPYNTGITIDPTKPNHVNYWIGTKAELAQGHRRKDLDVV